MNYSNEIVGQHLGERINNDTDSCTFFQNCFIAFLKKFFMLKDHNLKNIMYFSDDTASLYKNRKITDKILAFELSGIFQKIYMKNGL